MLLKLGTQHTQGEIIYPLDDTYIHMAVAKNFVEHHVWGITQYAFRFIHDVPPLDCSPCR